MIDATRRKEKPADPPVQPTARQSGGKHIGLECAVQPYNELKFRFVKFDALFSHLRSEPLVRSWLDMGM